MLQNSGHESVRQVMHNQDNFMISLQLVKGTTLVFLDFAHEFFNVINQTIDH